MSSTLAKITSYKFAQTHITIRNVRRAEISKDRSSNNIDISFSWNTMAKTALLVAFAFLVEHQNIILGLRNVSILVQSPATWDHL